MEILNFLAEHKDWIIPLVTGAFSAVAALFFRFSKNPVKNHNVFGYLYEYIHRISVEWAGDNSKKARYLKRVAKLTAVEFDKWLRELVVCKDELTAECLIKGHTAVIDSINRELRAGGAPEIFITKWNEYMAKTYNSVYIHIKESGAYKDGYNRKFYVLTMIQLLFFGALGDLNETLKVLNGELDEFFTS